MSLVKWLGCVVACLATSQVHAQEGGAPSADEQAVRAAATAYVEALDRGDVKAMQSMWVPGGDIVDELGRPAPASQIIEQEAKLRSDAPKDAPRPAVKQTENTIRFLTADVALEDGQVEVTQPNSEFAPTRGRYLAVWIKQDGAWKLASLRESRVPATVLDDLAALDWMVGDWTGTHGKTQFDVTAHWNPKHTFLERDLKVMHEGKEIYSGQQRIGIDPQDGRIKSWMHDADGGHGEGQWTRRGDTWVVQAQGVAPDGRPTVAMNTYARAGDHGIVWKSMSGLSSGESKPDFEIELKRTGATER